MITPCIKHFNELNSTNSFALEHFDEFEIGDVISADIQTHGRGRFNRVWEGDSSENIYASFVIKPKNTEKFPFINLTQYLSVVVCNVFKKKYGLSVNIKWPNDILYENKKLVGILAEARIKRGQLDGIVLGMGINVNYAPVDIVPNSVCLRGILNKKTDKKDLLNSILEEFFSTFDIFSNDGFKSIDADYKSLCQFGETVKIGNSYKEGEFQEYKFRKLNDDGTLTVLAINENGKEEEVKIVSGDILC